MHGSLLYMHMCNYSGMYVELAHEIKVPREDLGNTVNPALSQEFHLFCEQEHPQATSYVVRKMMSENGFSDNHFSNRIFPSTRSYLHRLSKQKRQ